MALAGPEMSRNTDVIATTMASPAIAEEPSSMANSPHAARAAPWIVNQEEGRPE
jgi:hypothetical protein